MFRNKRRNGDVQVAIKDASLIDLRGVSKAYKTDAGEFTALDGVTLQIDQGEFVSIVGKSGSGKTTLINMLTGIDRPTGGEIHVAGTAVHHLNESDTATWRGKNLGVVFQFFQLLPTLTVLENVTLPMGLCNLYTRRERIERARHLLELVGIADEADKLPSRLSGGQQQRAAIARAMANDPPIIATDEPTGNLDSHAAEAVMQLFESLVDQGKTVLMVTHDPELAERAPRTITLANGELLNEYLVRALPTLPHDLLLDATRQIETSLFAPGELIIEHNAEPDKFYVITKGDVEVVLPTPDGKEVLLDSLGPGQFFGEIALLNGGLRTALVRASHAPVEVVALSKEVFLDVIHASKETLSELADIITLRTNRLALAGSSQ
ncbi:MAG: ATP-binding cassette domain-containing protein [Anaerolineae bacterium]|nr:ATP-binding cassette domain-containing protein [Anaerolineae bacterium]